MPPVLAKNFAFVCGQDDFLVGRMAKARFDALAAETTDDFSREIVNGFAGNVGEVEAAVNLLREAVQTVSMFGGRRAIWLKDVNFLADTPTGRAEGTLALVEDLKQILESVNPAESAVLVSAAPVDRRRAFPKWCEKTADYALADEAEGGSDALAGVLIAEARAAGVTFAPAAIDLLVAKVGPNTRLLVTEVHKLAAHADEGARIEEADVERLSPNAAQGDFFESAEAFFSGDLRWTLDALHRHFFAGGDGRPVIAALQNRNRLLLQIRALVDAGEVRVGPRGVDGLAQAGARHQDRYAGAFAEKSAYNVFTQHPFYLGKLLGNAKLPTLRRLIDNQREFIAVFEEIIRRPDEQEEVFRDLAVRCLAPG